MTAFALALAALLAQTADPVPAAAPAAAPATAPATAPAAAPATAGPASPAASPGPRVGGVRSPVSVEEVNRQLERIKKMDPEHRAEAERELARKMGAKVGRKERAEQEGTGGFDISGMASMSDVEQVRLMSRIFVSHLISGDARSLVLLSTFPFQLEDRKLATPEELHKEWLKNLRPKRTDVLTLYGVEVLTGADMEKKYGKPPARLSAMPFKAPKTWVAVTNLSGHPAVIVWRQVAELWQAVGYTD